MANTQGGDKLMEGRSFRGLDGGDEILRGKFRETLELSDFFWLQAIEVGEGFDEVRVDKGGDVFSPRPSMLRAGFEA